MASKIAAVVTAIDTIIQSKATFASTETKPVNEQKTGYFAITYEDTGRFEQRSSGWGQSFHAVSSYIMGPFTNMEQTFIALEGVCEAVALAIHADETLGAKCDTLGDVTYANHTIELAGVKYTGYKLTVSEIKIAR